MAPSVTVLGAGSWGTALALLLAKNGVQVDLWGYDPQEMAVLARERINSRYLPNHPFPLSLSIIDNLETLLAKNTILLIAVPSHGFVELIKKIKPYMGANPRIAWGTKGIDATTGLLFHEVIDQLINNAAKAVISGPSLATEVANELPTAVTLASNVSAFALELAGYLRNQYFRVYTNEDLAGVELCGVIKNIFAIACGISDGLNLGCNARSALITRALAEMNRLCMAMGGQAQTLMGLAGVGDLILTCTSKASRNYRFGFALGEKKSVAQAAAEINQAIEGLYNLAPVYQLAARYQVEMPILRQVYRIVYEGLPPIQAVNELLARNPQSETHP